MPLGDNNLTQMAGAVYSFVARVLPPVLHNFSVAQAFTAGDEKNAWFQKAPT